MLSYRAENFRPGCDHPDCPLSLTIGRRYLRMRSRSWGFRKNGNAPVRKLSGVTQPFKIEPLSRRSWVVAHSLYRYAVPVPPMPHVHAVLACVHQACLGAVKMLSGRVAKLGVTVRIRDRGRLRLSSMTISCLRADRLTELLRGEVLLSCSLRNIMAVGQD